MSRTDRHFLEIIKSCSEHPKTCKFIKNQKAIICTKLILSSIYIEESKKERERPGCFVKAIKQNIQIDAGNHNQELHMIW